MCDYKQMKKDELIALLEGEKILNEKLTNEIQKQETLIGLISRQMKNIEKQLSESNATIVRMANSETMRQDYEGE